MECVYLQSITQSFADSDTVFIQLGLVLECVKHSPRAILNEKEKTALDGIHIYTFFVRVEETLKCGESWITITSHFLRLRYPGVPNLCTRVCTIWMWCIESGLPLNFHSFATINSPCVLHVYYIYMYYIPLS